jgi:hypothetical protein
MLNLASKGFDAVETDSLEGDAIMVAYTSDDGDEEVIYSTLCQLKRLVRDYPIFLVALSSEGFTKLEAFRNAYDAAGWA